MKLRTKLSWAAALYLALWGANLLWRAFANVCCN